MNKNLVLITGKSATGKSASLRNLTDPQGVYFLNCEAGKELPFPAKFKSKIVTDPMFVHAAFEAVEQMSDIHTVVIDTLTFLMDLYESMYVLGSTNTMKAWGDYAQFFKKLMQDDVANSSKNVIMLAHTGDIYNEKEMIVESMVKVKGSTMNQGVEAYFTQVISSKKILTKKLAGYKNPLLTITPQEEALGFKYVFQTQLTKETVNERIRSPLGMWPTEYTYIDNDIQKVIDHTHSYYGNP